MFLSFFFICIKLGDYYHYMDVIVYPMYLNKYTSSLYGTHTHEIIHVRYLYFSHTVIFPPLLSQYIMGWRHDYANPMLSMCCHRTCCYSDANIRIIFGLTK